ncbi:MAG: peptidoglycan-binding protein [Okeania sp. SIO2G4]|uniref:peptidoglycan-binding domain-containing protein n=1 Tax=unclassified Okeania TaxID=2634635 RepID=UPI0013B9F87A|nr:MULTISPECIES: peptidoglycan-binding protein [unclassified Okeania]NEP07521.1 peptidoglycan-binding protein [Okeania sp. SIO4D6]NEP46562.1 peptidoglycan-binding protein [Okeania sp. SIO2H7]NEP75373.1 peptidoglycan-binding protein [Okeania sp. SIO2G5]NEP96453.1 peptidoglycan-binding protein [Okeania sp. SIO2F5]NEQ94206.1 peptidoglycan-binding protein [Okeania sp. SIO2G4]
MTLSVSSSFSLPVLRNGSNGYDVTLIQRLLNNAGYGSLVEDGIFGVSTDTAVKQFQQDRNLIVDGIVGSQTWAALLPPTIGRGSSGDDVKRLQITMNETNYGTLVVDGIFGSNTEAYVKAFQTEMSLEVDGIVGPLTWYVLMSNQIQH